MLLFLSGCKDAYRNQQNIWDRYNRNTFDSSYERYVKLTEVHDKKSRAFTYSPYGADFR